jgi:O-antigen/teichoic acid export membrane protein
MASSIVVARAMSLSDFGQYSLVMAFVTTAAMPSMLGVPNLLVREIARYETARQHALVKGLLLRSVQFVVITSVLTVIVFLMVYFFKPSQAEGGISNADLYLLGFLAVPLLSLNAIRGAALRGFHRVLLGQIPESIVLPTAFLCIFYFSEHFYNANSSLAMKAQLAALVTSFLVGTIFMFKVMPLSVRTAKPAYESARWIRSAVPLSVLSGMQVINAQVGVLVLGVVSTAADVAVFKVAEQIALVISFSSAAVTLVSAPVMARLYYSGEKNRLQNLIRASSRATFIFSTPTVVIFVVAGKWLIHVAYGEDFDGSYSLLVVLCVGQLVNSFYGAVTTLLSMAGKETIAVRGWGVALAINIALSLLLAPRLQAEGVAVASSITLMGWNWYLSRQCRKVLGIETAAFSLRRNNLVKQAK